jgi:hypothetical protein
MKKARIVRAAKTRFRMIFLVAGGLCIAARADVSTGNWSGYVVPAPSGTTVDSVAGTTYQQNSSAQQSSAEWIAEDPNGSLPLAEFGTVTFSDASAALSTGQTGPISDFSYDTLALGATSSGLGARPSPLNSTGSSFSIATTWPGDVNSDGRVDINDLTLVLANFGNTLGGSEAGGAAVPEPSIVALLAAGLGSLAWVYVSLRRA